MYYSCYRKAIGWGLNFLQEMLHEALMGTDWQAANYITAVGKPIDFPVGHFYFFTL